MQSFKFITVFLSCICTLFLSSCIDYDEVEIRDIRSIKLKEFSTKGLVVESDVQINNPNSFNIDIVDSEFNVYVKNKNIGKARIDSKVKLSSNSEDYHTLVLKSEYQDLSKNALSNLLTITASGGERIDFKVDGFIVGKAMWMKKKVEVSHEGKVPLKLY